MICIKCKETVTRTSGAGDGDLYYLCECCQALQHYVLLDADWHSSRGVTATVVSVADATSNDNE